MNTRKILNEVRIFLLMLLVVTSLRSALADWNDVPTGSMKPTIQEGDRVVVNKLAYDLKVPFTTIRIAKWADPQRGDIVVLFSPLDGVRLVKRVIGIPGDRIYMKENQLYVNGKAAEWRPIGSGYDRFQGTTMIVEENLAGRMHQVMFSPQQPSEHSFGPMIVPSGFYYVMGDNRDNSRDSRYIGLIGRRQIVGEATAVAFSLDRSRYFAPRMDRFFRSID